MKTHITKLLILPALIAGLGLITAGRVTAQTNVSTTVVAWGGSTDLPAGLTNIVAVAAGSSHNLALRSDGTVVAWGDNQYGQTNISADLTNLVAVSAGWRHSLALKSDGTVVAWGWNGDGACNVPTGLTNVVAVVAAYRHSLALKADGTVVAWGWNDDGQCNVPSWLNDGVAIAGSRMRSLALRSDGTVLAWGYLNTLYNVPYDLNNVVAIAAGDAHALALKIDGTVYAWGFEGTATNVPVGLSNVTAIAAGYWSSLALRSDGTVVAWGDNSGVPLGLTNVAAISAADSLSLALAGDVPPFITQQPTSLTVYSGTSARFSVKASGPSLSFQWQFNGTNIDHATNSFVTLTGVHSVYAGTYRVLITNTGGMVSSLDAVLTVSNSPPIITSQPLSQLVPVENGVIFYVTAKGGVPLRYQWQFNGTNVLWATNFFFTLNAVQTANNGNYSVVVSNDYGVTVSSNAVLSVFYLFQRELDSGNLVWRTGYEAPWYGQNSETHDGVAALRSGWIDGYSDPSWLETTVTGPGTISFWWKVSSERWYDYLKFSIAGAEQAAISWEMNWEQGVFFVPAGPQTLRWVYSKDGSVNKGQDCGWLDQVLFTSSASSPIPIRIQSSGNSAILSWTNSAFTLQSAPAVTGTYTNIPGANSPYTNPITSAQIFFRLIANY